MSTLASENEDLVVGDLVGQTHVPWNPLGLVQSRRGALVYLLPHVLGDVVALDRVDYVLLVNPAPKCKYEVVLEGAEGHT